MYPIVSLGIPLERVLYQGLTGLISLTLILFSRSLSGTQTPFLLQYQFGGPLYGPSSMSLISHLSEQHLASEVYDTAVTAAHFLHQPSDHPTNISAKLAGFGHGQECS